MGAHHLPKTPSPYRPIYWFLGVFATLNVVVWTAVAFR